MVIILNLNNKIIFLKALISILIIIFFTVFYSAQSQHTEELLDKEGIHQKELLPETVLKQSIKRLQQDISTKDEFAIRMKMADAYLKIKKPDFAKSTEMLFKAKEIAENADDVHLKAKIYGSIANQYSFLNFTDKIKPYLDLSQKQVMQLPEGFEKNFLTARLFIEYGNLDADQANFSSAKKNYQHALKALQKNGNPMGKDVFQYRRAFYNIGVSYAHLEENDSAEYFLNKALEIRDLTKPKATDIVQVKYTGKLLDGTVFDSTDKNGGSPADINLSAVIKGWTEGIQLMSKGAKYRFYIPSDLAYGDQGAGDAIPGGSTIIFDVELVNIN